MIRCGQLFGSLELLNDHDIDAGDKQALSSGKETKKPMRTNHAEQERPSIRDMDVEAMARVILHHLQENYNSYLDGSRFAADIEDLRSDAFSIVNDSGSRFDTVTVSDNAKILEAVTLLERRGLVVRNVRYQALGGAVDQFVVYLTSIGINTDVDAEGRLLVDKPEEIVTELQESVEALDPVVRQYYLESIRACQAGLYISSVICLGAASERAINCLAMALKPLSRRYQQNIEKARNIAELTQYLSGVIFNIFDNERGFAKELKELLDELGQLYRKNRNDAGHPDTIEQTSWLREGQVARLDLFRRYIVTICEAIERLKKQSVS